MATPKTLVVAGGGVVGLSVARAAARAGLQVLLLESNARVGMETSARNSEVVHAGIYYAKDSWKARLCVRGREQLYAFCDQYSVPYKKCGKLIVASASEHQHEQLRSIAKRGLANGVTDLRWLSKDQAREIEPHVECQEALYSPSTGIIDSHSLMLALQGDAEAHGAVVAVSTTVRGGVYNEKDKTFVIRASQGEADSGEEHEVGLPTVPKLFAKGTYFKLRESVRPFRGLVYPIPEVGGLGVHSTVDMEGNVRFGPDVEWVNEINYVPNPSKANEFAERIRSYWPQVSADQLIADYCGIRPKINLNGSVYEDFFLMDASRHGMPGLVHLCGFESPGLTSSLAIANTVLEMLQTGR
uniref:L-2-hydroxyglutarate dehydrogenase, mitochondrial n=1 Tax=Globisporangium ultimum (strain ATCC 200006 / CBS 805.95 / DAOM BR144) TaxID=431595 RepID=K3WP38_GLOUD